MKGNGYATSFRLTEKNTVAYAKFLADNPGYRLDLQHILNCCLEKWLETRRL